MTNVNVLISTLISYEQLVEKHRTESIIRTVRNFFSKHAIN